MPTKYTHRLYKAFQKEYSQSKQQKPYYQMDHQIQKYLLFPQAQQQKYLKRLINLELDDSVCNNQFQLPSYPQSQTHDFCNNNKNDCIKKLQFPFYENSSSQTLNKTSKFRKLSPIKSFDQIINEKDTPDFQGSNQINPVLDEFSKIQTLSPTYSDFFNCAGQYFKSPKMNDPQFLLNFQSIKPSENHDRTHQEDNKGLTQRHGLFHKKKSSFQQSEKGTKKNQAHITKTHRKVPLKDLLITQENNRNRCKTQQDSYQNKSPSTRSTFKASKVCDVSSLSINFRINKNQKRNHQCKQNQFSKNGLLPNRKEYLKGDKGCKGDKEENSITKRQGDSLSNQKVLYSKFKLSKMQQSKSVQKCRPLSSKTLSEMPIQENINSQVQLKKQLLEIYKGKFKIYKNRL